MDYLRAKILWNHLEGLSVTSNEVSKELALVTTGLSLLDCKEDEHGPSTSIGGVTSNDMSRYGSQCVKLTQTAIGEIARSLDTLLTEVTLYYHSAEELDDEALQACKLKLDESVKADLARGESDYKELIYRLETVLNLNQEAVEVHSRLQSSLEDAMRKLPPLLNAKDTASAGLLALKIETSLLQLSVVRARMRASLYGYTSSTNPNATMTRAVNSLYEKLTAQECALDVQKRDLQRRLQDYQNVLELVDEQNGFAQIVKDLAMIRKEIKDCRKDLRRLGWTED